MKIAYDDSMLSYYRTEIENFLLDLATINPESVIVKNRVSVKKIREAIERRFPELKFGRNVNNTEIGNCKCYELICNKGEKNQIFCLLHLTRDTFGNIICWLADYYDNPIDDTKIKIKNNLEVHNEI